MKKKTTTTTRVRTAPGKRGRSHTRKQKVKKVLARKAAKPKVRQGKPERDFPVDDYQYDPNSVEFD